MLKNSLAAGLRRVLVPVAAAVMVAAGAAAAAAPAQAAYALKSGADVSWPECPPSMGIPSRRGEGNPLPPNGTELVVLGLTNGPGFYPNPCLSTELAWAKAHHTYTSAYAMTTYPTAAQQRTYGGKGPYRGADQLTRLRNTGYAEAQYNIATMHRLGFTSPVVWVDVEPYRVAPWSSSTTGNKAVVDGAIRAYQAAGYRVGVYSTSALWRGVVGNARYGVPEWHTAGQTSRTAALRQCTAASFNGGRIVQSQWWTSPTGTDWDVTCPGYSSPAAMASYFHKY